MSDTPRTDEKTSDGLRSNVYITVDADFARQLERENTALREQLDNLTAPKSMAQITLETGTYNVPPNVMLAFNQLRAEVEALREDKKQRQYYDQWYPSKEMLPLNKAEGAERNYVLAAWIKNDRLVSMRTCFCDSNGVWWVTPETRTKTEPNFWRELPDWPTIARAAEGGKAV